MKFTVELEDFYLEEGDLNTELKSFIKSEVVSKLYQEIKAKVDSFMDTHVKQVITTELQTRVQILMDDFLAKGVIKDRYGKDSGMTVPDYIKESFNAKGGDIHKKVEQLVSMQVSELQRRYDILFATQILAKINEKGFLKEDIARLLLTEEGKG